MKGDTSSTWEVPTFCRDPMVIRKKADISEVRSDKATPIFLTSAKFTNWRMQPCYYKSQHYATSPKPEVRCLIGLNLHSEINQKGPLSFPILRGDTRTPRCYLNLLGCPSRATDSSILPTPPSFRVALFLQFGAHHWKLLSTLDPFFFFLSQLLVTSRQS